MPSTLSKSAKTPAVPLSLLGRRQQQPQEQQQSPQQVHKPELQWSPISNDTSATGTEPTTTTTFDASSAIEYADPLMLAPFQASPLIGNELAFLFNSTNSVSSNVTSTCTTSSTASSVDVTTGSDKAAVGGMKRGYDEMVEQGESQTCTGRRGRKAKRGRVMMGSGSVAVSPLSDDEVKRMRRVKNRESVEKCRMKQRLRIEALQVEQSCLKSENEMVRATVMQVDSLLRGLNKSGGGNGDDGAPRCESKD